MNSPTTDITAGDIVRLRHGGHTVVVDSVCSSYHDRSGDHEGPFVRTREGVFAPVSEVAEIVAPNPNRCQLCGEGVTSKDPEHYPYCRNCHYTGQVEEALRAEQLAAMTTALDGPAVAVWHTGGGCMMLTVSFSDEPGTYYGLTDGEASLPKSDPAESDRPLAGGGWGLVIRYEGEEDQEGTAVLAYWNELSTADHQRYWDEYPKLSFSDAQVVEAILKDRKERGR